MSSFLCLPPPPQKKKIPIYQGIGKIGGGPTYLEPHVIY